MQWFIVWLLRKLTLRWPELVVSATDNDGAFPALPHRIPSYTAARRCGEAARCASSLHGTPPLSPAQGSSC